MFLKIKKIKALWKYFVWKGRHIPRNTEGVGDHRYVIFYPPPLTLLPYTSPILCVHFTNIHVTHTLKDQSFNLLLLSAVIIVLIVFLLQVFPLYTLLQVYTKSTLRYSGGTRYGAPLVKRKNTPTRRGDIAWRAEI